MLRNWFFTWKYKILKDPANLSKQTERFFKMPYKSQKNILDKYFDKFSNYKDLYTYFDSKESRIYKDSAEITFFHNEYFDQKLIEHDIKSIALIDKFHIDKQAKENLLTYTLEKLKKENITIKAKDLVSYPDDLPKTISNDLKFMTYLVNQDEANIKYITYNETCIKGQRDLIKEGIEKAKNNDFSLKKFLKVDGNLPKILETNFDFLVYLIENDIDNIDYLDDNMLDNLTLNNRNIIIKTIINSLEKKPNYIKNIEKNISIASILNKDEQFIQYIISEDLDNIKYVDWHNLHDLKRENTINYFTKILEKENIDFDIMKYSFHELFFQNFKFMNYLINKDFRWIAVIKIDDKNQIEELIDLFFAKLSKKNYRFHLEDFLEDGEYLNHRLVENQKMLHFFFQNKVPVIKYIDFFRLTDAANLVECILKELEKSSFEFKNDEFLINGKYPTYLSNNYRFMRYVIDKNFNNLAYIDTSLIDENELKRIINYAFRMVYFIRGNDKNLNFDIEGYFKNSDIVNNNYFQECLKSI